MSRLLSLLSATAVGWIVPLCAFAQSMDDGGIFDTPEIKKENVLKPSKKAVNLTFPVPSDCDAFGFELVMNFPGVIKVQTEYRDDQFKKSFSIRPGSQILENEKSAAEMLGMSETEIKPPEPVFPNHVLHFFSKTFRAQYYVMPRFLRYKTDQVNKKISKWEETIPNALKRRMRVDLRPSAKGLNIYLDGTYAGELIGGRQLKAVKITGGSGPMIANANAYRDMASTPEWEAVDFGWIANSGAMKDGKISLKPGFGQVEGVPMFVSDGARSSDLSLVKGLKGLNFTAEEDYYMMRNAWERLPESQQGSVPTAFYDEAYVLFALDPDPSKDRAFSFRLGRFANRVVGFATTDVILPKDEADFPANIKKVGTVNVKGKDLPLYLGRFDVPCGKITDIIMKDPAGNRSYMNYEFMGRRSGQGTYGDASHRPSGVPSAVNVFGVTFHRAPVSLSPVFSEPGNIFFNDEKLETAMEVTAVRPGTYTLRWTMSDTFRKELRRGEQSLTFAKAGEKQTVTIPLYAPDPGHYYLDFELWDGDRVSLFHPAAYAYLGKDTRLAEPIESPFGSWWTPHHYGTNDPDIFMKIFHKAGIRRTNLGKQIDSKGNIQPKSWAEKIKQYKMTLNQLGWMTPKGKTDEEFDQEMHAYYDPMIKAFPDCRYLTVFHESYGDEPVVEVRGEKGKNNERCQRFAGIATKVAAWFRKNHPQIKLCYGNNTSSSALTAALLRNDFNPEYLDFIGIETPGQGCIPERLWQGGTQGIWFAQETGRTWGHKLRVTGCFEFSARPDRLFGTLNEQAAYYMRDALIGLSYGFETLGISGSNDAGDWYPQTIWGTGGLCQRCPYMYPKPMLVSYATMTKALDQIKFEPKTMDTGNLSCYAVEFERKRGDIVYAVWVPRGESEVEVAFPKDVKAELMDFYGKTRNVGGKTVKLTASIYPQYLIAPVKAESVKHVRTLSPEPPASFQVLEEFTDLSKLRPMAASRALRQNDLFLKAGKFTFREVTDEEKGKCLEATLVKEGSLPDISPEYIRVQLKQPIVLPGTPDELGIWIKGDGGWGKIAFEIQDARGMLYRNEGAWTDFGALSYFNFKGWYFLRYPLEAKGLKLRRNQSLGGFWTGRGRAEFPLKLTAIYLTMRRKTLNPNTMKEAPGVIRLKDFGIIVNPEYQPKVKEETSK